MTHRTAIVSILLCGLGCGGASPSEDDTGDAESTASQMPSDLASLGDDFEGAELEGWAVYQPDRATISVTDGQLHVVPAARSLWYNASTATQIHRDVVHERFMVTAAVTVRRESAPDLPPEPQYRLGGLMLRNADAASPNYIFIVLGADADDVSVETKTTVDGTSTFDGPPWPSGSGELRICRWGAEFRLLVRSPGDVWNLRATYTRPDFPERLAAGPVAYANNETPDVRVSYESVDFAELITRDDCLQ